MRARTKTAVLTTSVRATMIGLASLLLVALSACGSSSSVNRPAMSPTATHIASVVYVALGASDAVGVGATDPNTQGYVPVLISRLPQDAEALNLGVSGYKVHDALQNKITAAVNAHPTLVTVWLAANDFRDCTPLNQYTSDLNALLDQLQKQTKAQVFVANLPDMSLLPAMRPGSQGLGACHQTQTIQQLRAETQTWNGAIAQTVNSHGDDLIDLYRAELASHPEYISGDGFHPTTVGYLRLADLFWADIQAKHAVPAA
jgi:lysophospholipase L1-like esterase